MEEKKTLAEVIDKQTDKILKGLSGSEFKRSRKLVENIKGFMSISGGAGASTIVANLAYKMISSGMSVAIIDLNICYPCQYMYASMDTKIDRLDAVNYLYGEYKLKDCLWIKGDLALLTANNRNIGDRINLDKRDAGDNLDLAIDRLSELYDVVLIDIPKEIDHTLVDVAMYKIDEIYFIWDESISSISNYIRLKDNMGFTGLGNKREINIMNKRTGIRYSESILAKLKVEISDILYMSEGVIESGLRGEIYCKKGQSIDKTGKEFEKAIESILNKIIINGGGVI